MSLGFAANRTRWLTNSDTVNRQVMARSGHRAWFDISTLQVYINNSRLSPVNILNDFLGEVGLGAIATVTASIEYPEGVFTQLLFSGSPIATVTDKEILISDAVTLPSDTIIAEGAIFWVRQFWQNPNGIFFNDWQDSATYGDTTRIAVSGLSDQTLSGTINDNCGYSFPPACIVAERGDHSSVGIVGDSIGYGNCGPDGGEAAPYIADTGVVAKTIASVGPMLNLSACGQGAYAGASTNRYWISSGQPRRELIQYCTHIVSQLGINDLDGATGSIRTAAELVSDLQTLWDLLKSTYGLPTDAPIIQITLAPHSTSTDGFITVENQTPYPVDATSRITFNTDVRALILPTEHFYEVANVLESSFNSGLWSVSGGLNWLPDANDFSTASWAHAFTTVVSGQSDPVGGTDGWKFIEDTNNAVHYTANIVQYPAPAGTYTFSVYSKYGANRRLSLRVAGGGGVDFNYVVYDLAGSQIGSSGTGGSNFTLDSFSMIPIGLGGWFRCTMTITCTEAIDNVFCILDQGTGTNPLDQGPYVGDGSSFVYLYGAQLQHGTVATEYSPLLPVAGTDDGLHPTNAGYALVASSGAIITSYLFPAIPEPIVVIPPPMISLSWSNDRGKTFGFPVEQSLGDIGEYLTTVSWNRLGMARDRVFKLQWDAAVPISLNGAFITFKPNRS